MIFFFQYKFVDWLVSFDPTLRPSATEIMSSKLLEKFRSQHPPKSNRDRTISSSSSGSLSGLQATWLKQSKHPKFTKQKPITFHSSSHYSWTARAFPNAINLLTTGMCGCVSFSVGLKWTKLSGNKIRQYQIIMEYRHSL